MASSRLAPLLGVNPALGVPAEVVAAVAEGLPPPATGENTGGTTVGPIAW